MNIPYSIFETDFKVRPDDIDMFQHVHNSKYFDYVLAARYDQMERFYGMPMEQFMQQGFGWVVRTAYVDYKRALTLGDTFVVRTGLESFGDNGCRVQFEIINQKTKKICCDGWFDYILIDIATGRATKVSQEMIEKYTI